MKMDELVEQTKSMTALLHLDLPVKKDLLQKSKPAQHCYINAQNDLEAARCWLDKYTDSPKTHQVYQREVMRFLMWCQFEAGKTLQELTSQDFEVYFKFIQNPPKKWCASRRQIALGRCSKHWRPFIGGVGQASFNKIIAVLSSFISYLTHSQYLTFNALDLTKKTRGFSLSRDEVKYQVWNRMLEDDEWQAVQNALESLPETSILVQQKKLRIQFLFAMLYFLGLRIEELSHARWNYFRFHQHQWWFFVKGKGGKYAHIPVHDKLLSFVKIYRASLGFIPLPTIKDDEHLFVSPKTNQPLKIRQLFAYVKEIGVLASQQFSDNAAKEAKLKALSPHWLRHLSASHQAKAGIHPVMIQNNLRHQSYQTTQIYLHSEDDMRHHEIQKLDVKFSPKTNHISHAQNNTVRLKALLKKGPMDRVASVSTLIDVIEQEILVGINFEKEGFDKPQLLADIQHSFDPNMPIYLNYILSNINTQQLQCIKKQIQREAQIRMFDIQL